MFQFGRFPTYTYEFSIRYTDITPYGFPHSEIHGSMPICGSPWLIAAYHVFRRLPVPRHSPCALFRLTFFRQTRITEFVPLNYVSIGITLFAKLCCYPCFFHNSFCLVFLSAFTCFLRIQFSKYSGGPKWTRTIDLTIISRAL